MLTPYKIGEFLTFDPDYTSENETYTYRADPNGKYYHFEDFVTGGASSWDALVRYEELISASSTLTPTSNISYDAENLRNDKKRSEGGGDRSLTWCEGVKGYGIGERITMCVRTKTHTVDADVHFHFTSLLIVNGYAKNATTWKNNSRVKTLRLYVDDKHWCDLQLEDVIQPQFFAFPEELKIYPAKVGHVIPQNGAFTNPLPDEYLNISIYETDLRFEILEVYPGDKYDDTCITGIALDVMGGVY